MVPNLTESRTGCCADDARQPAQLIGRINNLTIELHGTRIQLGLDHAGQSDSSNFQ